MKTLAAILVLAALPGCAVFRELGLARNEPDQAAVRIAGPEEPAHVVVQHVLISFEGTGVPGVTRSKDEAKRLAELVLAEARRGRDFADLVRTYSDDRGDGIHALANWGVAPAGDEAERKRRVRGFATLAFALASGEIGLVEYDAAASPYGWHVMKRIR